MSIPAHLGEAAVVEALAVASELAREAGRIQLEHLDAVERIEHKTARDVVTEVDHLCEAAIIHGIRTAYPRDGVVAEESGVHVGADGRDGASGRRWIVDPLDGTVNYANGLPLFCVSIALAVGDEPVLGVVYDPTRDEMFTAISGGGARRNGEPIRNPDKELLSDYLVMVGPWRGGAASGDARIGGAVRAGRSMGTAALSLAYVATGRFDAFLQRDGLSVWDIAAAGLVAAEGGATVTTAAGERWFDLSRPSGTVGILAAPARHHARLRELAG